MVFELLGVSGSPVSARVPPLYGVHIAVVLRTQPYLGDPSNPDSFSDKINFNWKWGEKGITLTSVRIKDQWL